MLRIHFTAEDLDRTTLEPEADPLWEVLLSLHMLQVDDGPIAYGAWRQQIRRQLPRALVEPLALLAPPVGYSPDFLTPPTASGELADGLQQILATPRHRLRQEISLLPARQTSTNWVRQLASGQREAVGRLGSFMRQYHASALVPYWDAIKVAVDADHRNRLRQLAGGGTAAVLGGIHPQARMREQILEIDAFRDEDLYLDGRGIRLQPSYFCWSQPSKLMDPGLPPVLVFPISNATGLVRDGARGSDTMHNLIALLGRTRAMMLARTADRATTTTELASSCNVGLATASYQASVLRNGGLIVSRRQGKSVLHSASELGRLLLEGAASVAGENVAQFERNRSDRD